MGNEAHSDGDEDRVSITESEVDNLMTKAFGATLVQSEIRNQSDRWRQRWETVARLCGKKYDLPGGAVGHQYVDLLAV